jgi:hypothetical protein
LCRMLLAVKRRGCKLFNLQPSGKNCGHGCCRGRSGWLWVLPDTCLQHCYGGFYQ